MKKNKSVFNIISLFKKEGGIKWVYTIFDQAVVSITNFFTGVIIGRSCAKEEFGLYMLGFSIVLIIINIQTALISTPYTVFSPRFNEKERKTYNGSILLYQLSLIFFTMFILGFFLLFFKEIKPEGLLIILRALILGITFILLRDFVRHISFANLNFLSAFIVDIIVFLLQISFLLLLSSKELLSAYSAIIAISISCLCASLVWFILSHRQFQIVFKSFIPILSQSWKFGKWIFASSFVTILSTQIYPWLLTAFHGIEITGVYGACAGITFLANPFLIGAGNLLGPKTAHAFAEGRASELKQRVINNTYIILMIMGLFCLLMIIFGGFIVGFIYGDKYGGNGSTVSILALSQFSVAITIPLNHGLLSMERSDVGFKSYLLALIITASFGTLIVKILGLNGLALGLLTSNICASLYRFYIFRRQINQYKIAFNYSD